MITFNLILILVALFEDATEYFTQGPEIFLEHKDFMAI